MGTRKTTVGLFYSVALFAVCSTYVGTTRADISKRELATCAAIEGDLERLVCFDDLAARNELDNPKQTTYDHSDIGKWDVRVSTNPIDDTTKVVLVLEADKGKSKWGKPIYFVARCQSNETDVYITWGDYLDGSIKTVISRIGKQPASEWGWSISSDNEATFHPRPIRLLKEMLSADRFLAQTTPYNENPVTAIFDTSGMKQALKPLAETCHWELPEEKRIVNSQGTTGGEATDAQEQNSEVELVEQVQKLLTKRGYELGPIDGIIGEQTVEALKHFQSKHGMVVDGVIDESVLAALEDAVESGSQEKPKKSVGGTEQQKQEARDGCNGAGDDRVAKALCKYVPLIRQKIRRNWNRPPTAEDDVATTVNVTLSRNGEVIAVRVVRSSGNLVFDRSAENAVLKASPLPIPTEVGVNEEFRDLTLNLKGDW